MRGAERRGAVLLGKRMIFEPDGRSVLWCVSGGTQWADACLVLIDPALDGLRVQILDTQSGRVVEPIGPYKGDHWTPQDLRHLRRVRGVVARMRPTVVVVAQDASRTQQVVSVMARRVGARVVVVPDGVMLRGASDLSRRNRVIETLLQTAGWTPGKPGTFGSTAPDLWCAWGAAWPAFLRELSPTSQVAVTGYARGDALTSVPPVPAQGPVLICSQPLTNYPFENRPEAERAWYGWIERMAATSDGGIVVRLHPRERDVLADLPLGPATREILTTSRNLTHDLAEVSAVVAPLSTVLLEGSAAGRRVLSVLPDERTALARRSCAAFDDARLPYELVDAIADAAALHARLAEADCAPSSWGTDFVSTEKGSAARIAREIAALAGAGQPQRSSAHLAV